MSKVSPRPGILNIKPHMVATGVATSIAPRINLSSNESALGASPMATAAAREALDTMERYSEDGPTLLATAIGATFDLDPARIVVGHGSDELLQRLARGFLNPGDEVIHSRRGYLKFPNYAHAMGAIPVAAEDHHFRASVDGLLACVTPRTRMVLLANPDNPTGTTLGGLEVRRLHAGLPGNVLLVLDSAYAEYVTAADYELPVSLVNSVDNVVMTRTFSKIFGMAGMRLGWLYGPAAIVDVLRRLGLTFPISSPATAAGIAALRDTAHRDRVFAHNRDQLALFCTNLSNLGLRFLPSNGNFVLLDFEGQRITAKQTYDFLHTRGIVGRMFNSAAYGSMLRITIGTAQEMGLVTSALGDLMGSEEVVR